MESRSKLGWLAPLLFVALAAAPAAGQTPTVGLIVNTEQAQEGYTLFAPFTSTETYLIDIDGHVIRQWSSAETPGTMAYLMPDGHLVRAATTEPYDAHFRGAIGGGGRIEKFDWDGNLVWELDWDNADMLQHHDHKVLPNGNILFIAWEWKSQADILARGRNPALAAAGALWPDVLIEIQPTGTSGGTVVWEWRFWDHLIQDFDPTKENYGVVGDHPELLDINAGGDDGLLDFNHCNGVDYNPDLDQIALSCRAFSEIYIIDHSTTTAEAAGHTGGRYGRGGDFLYRWGNPEMYRRGTAADKKLFNQHDVQWIPPGSPGAGNLLIFNNGIRRADGNYSSIEEITPPLNAGGTYDINPGEAYGPTATAWQYFGSPRASFLSPIIAGVQRMPNGNTLIGEGTKGNMFEVTPSGTTVWRYVNPVVGTGPVSQGTPIAPAVPQQNSVFKMRRYPLDYPAFVGRDMTPGDMVEGYVPPPPVPDGTLGTSPLRLLKLDTAGTQLRVTWDALSCPAPDYNLLHGRLDEIDPMRLAGSLCALGTSGQRDWMGVPAGNSYVLMVGVGDFAMYESSWGTDSYGNQRKGGRPSFECNVTTKSLVETCP